MLRNLFVRVLIEVDDIISAKKEEDQVCKRVWILDEYTFCPFWSGIG